MVIDAGVGWGDTSVYFASIMNDKSGGHLYSFDVLEEGLGVLAEQMELNPGLDNITPIHRGLWDNDEDLVFVTTPSPGARITEQETGTQVKTTTIDIYMEQNNLQRLDMIKMDIEGSEVPALKGGAKAIERHKPKLAICVYHKWDDLLTIPRLIHSIRGDYRYYLDCTTGLLHSYRFTTDSVSSANQSAATGETCMDSIRVLASIWT